MCTTFLKIDLNNKPQSVQKKAYELKVLETTKSKVSKGIQNYAENLFFINFLLRRKVTILCTIRALNNAKGSGCFPN